MPGDSFSWIPSDSSGLTGFMLRACGCKESPALMPGNSFSWICLCAMPCLLRFTFRLLGLSNLRALPLTLMSILILVCLDAEPSAVALPAARPASGRLRCWRPGAPSTVMPRGVWEGRPAAARRGPGPALPPLRR